MIKDIENLFDQQWNNQRWKNCAKYGLDLVPDLDRNRSRNRNTKFSKNGTGTENSPKSESEPQYM
jgi:hypothetical protein